MIKILLERLKKWRISRLDDKFGDAAYAGQKKAARFYVKAKKLRGEKTLYEILSQDGCTIRGAELKPSEESKRKRGER